MKILRFRLRLACIALSIGLVLTLKRALAFYTTQIYRYLKENEVSYGFRFRFSLPKRFRISEESPVLEIQLHNSNSYKLKSYAGPGGRRGLFFIRLNGSSEPIRACDELMLVGNGFTSEEEALDSARGAITALILTSTYLGLAVDLGGNKPPFPSTQELAHIGMIDAEKSAKNIIELLQKAGITSGPVQAITDNGDIAIFNAEIPTIFVGAGTVTALSGEPSSRFTEAFARAHALNAELSAKQSLAFDLYFMSHFETSDQARFITLITAVESLIRRKKQSKQIREHIKSLIDLTEKSTLDSDESEYLCKRLSELKSESINQACQRFSAEYLGDRQYNGMRASEFFRECYKIRSQLVHNGKAKKVDRDCCPINELDRFIRDLLLVQVNHTYLSLSTEQYMVNPD